MRFLYGTPKLIMSRIQIKKGEITNLKISKEYILSLFFN